MQNFIEMEKNLKELTRELQNMKEEYASTIADGGASQHNRQKWSQGKIKIPKWYILVDRQITKSGNEQVSLGNSQPSSLIQRHHSLSY